MKKKKTEKRKKYKEQSSDAVHFRFSATGATLAGHVGCQAIWQEEAL